VNSPPRAKAHRNWTTPTWVFLVVLVLIASAGALLVSSSIPGGSRPAAVGTTATSSSAHLGGTTTPSLPAMAPIGPQFGIAYGDVLPWMAPSRMKSALYDAVAVGATWVRLDFSWSDVQPDGPGSFHWAGLDRVVTAARTLGLNVLPTLAYTPKWARPPGCTSDKCAPSSDAAFARFARAATSRYAPKGVRTWEIWNEENTPGFWKPLPSAAAYVALLDVAATAIRSVDPGAFIISGGLTATLTLRGAVDTRTFLQQMCALGANRVVDAVGYHPYTYPYLPTFTGPWATAWNKIAQTPISMVSILAEYGTPGLPVWLTEYGAPSSLSSTNSTATIGQVTEARQAQIATSAVSAMLSSKSIGALFWYTDQDLPGNSPLDHYGLRRADGTTKPAFAALDQAIHAARTSPTATMALH
jgi:hypothetical protein